MVEIRIYPDVAAVAQAAAHFVLSRIHTGQGHQVVALSGGSTPKLMYRELVQMPDAASLLSGEVVYLFSDERAVGPDSEQSNYRTAKVGLFEPLGIEERSVHRLRGEADDLSAEAQRYEKLICSIAPGDAGEVPRLDLVVLGMGADGHTASLFPDHKAASGESRLVEAPYVSSLKAYRLTFTFPLLNAAKCVLFVVTGSDKTEAVKKVLSAEIEGDILPARRVEAEQTIWLLDHAASATLDSTRSRGIVRIC